MQKATTLALATLIAASSLIAGCGSGGDSCAEHDGVIVCGDFGEPLFNAAITQNAGPVGWPPVALDEGGVILTRGTDLVRVGNDGSVVRLARFDSQLTAASAAPDGTIFITGSDGSTSTVKAYVAAKGSGQVQWNSPLASPTAGVPASFGDGLLHVATANGAGETALHDVRASDGKMLLTRPGASPAAVLPDGSLRYIQAQGAPRDAATGGPIYTKLIAEGQDGQVMWQHKEAAGIIDFAPGPDGETYIVSADRRLIQVSAQGQVAWTFKPQCEGCDVAAAPTVTPQAVYFPVWEQRPGMVTDMNGNPIDPLFALSRTGELLWQYDGFSLRNSHYSTELALFGVTDKETEVVTHHPSGRPVVAADGSSYVATDGAVVALDSLGKELGRAIYDRRAGEVTADFGGQSFTWINPGVTPSPVLSANGTLYVWDGQSVRGFVTGRKLAPSSWTAPFGGPSNSGRIE